MLHHVASLRVRVRHVACFPLVRKQSLGTPKISYLDTSKSLDCARDVGVPLGNNYRVIVWFLVMETIVVRSGKDTRQGLLRSKISNHKDLLPNLDGRSSAARRFRDLVAAFISDSAGIENVSEIRLNLIRRLAATVVAAETMEARMIDGENVDIATLCQLASTTVRISTRLGLDRRLREIVPDPLQYAREAAE